MTRIFLAHSQGDEDIRDFFIKIGGLAGVEVKAMEFETLASPAWGTIRTWLFLSNVLFVLLGEKIIDKGIFTQNWISFEIGIACGMYQTSRKDVWVFEPFQYNVRFPVPFLDHYMLYDIDDVNSMNYIRAIMEGYKSLRKKIPQGFADVECPHCGVNFKLHTQIQEFNCPTCRTGIKFLNQIF